MLVNVDHTGPPLKKTLKKAKIQFLSSHWKLTISPVLLKEQTVIPLS